MVFGSSLDRLKMKNDALGRLALTWINTAHLNRRTSAGRSQQELAHCIDANLRSVLRVVMAVGVDPVAVIKKSLPDHDFQVLPSSSAMMSIAASRISWVSPNTLESKVDVYPVSLARHSISIQ